MSTTDEARRLAGQRPPGAYGALYDWAIEAEQMLRAKADQIERLTAERDALKATLHDELTENLRLRDMGGARQDEGMTAYIERLVAERDAEAARAELHADLCARTAQALGLERFEGRSDMPERVAALVAERDGLRADAERYRWLRDGDSNPCAGWCIAYWDIDDAEWVADCRDARFIDAAIDAARGALAAKEPSNG